MCGCFGIGFGMAVSVIIIIMAALFLSDWLFSLMAEKGYTSVVGLFVVGAGLLILGGVIFGGVKLAKHHKMMGYIEKAQA